MIIKKLFLLLIILLIFISPGMVAQSEDEAAAGSAITDIDVRETNGTTKIEIKSSEPFTYKIYRPSDPYKVIVELQETALGEFTEKISVDRSGVLEIIPSEDMNAVRLEISLAVPVDVEPLYRENQLILAFDNPDVEAPETAGPVPAEGDIQAEEETGNIDWVEALEAIEAMEAIEGMDDEDAPEAEEDAVDTEVFEAAEYLPEPQETEEEEAPRARRYIGEKISIDFQDAELIHVFRLLADVSGFNIVVSPDVKGKFSMKLIDVPWDQALDVILRNYQLSKSRDGNIIRIAPTSVLAREEEEIAKAKESQEKAGNLVTRIYPINYADVKSVKKAIDEAKILTKRGFISVDQRTTSVIIKDVDKKHVEYENLISALDMPTPQVSIDARIVEVTKGFTRELGIQWGALVKPTPQTVISGTGLGVDSGFFSGNPLLVNLPATVGRGSGGSVGIGYIGAGALQALDFQLSAMETSGKGKVISNPRIITMDHQEAVIRQGKKIPYETISDEGTKTEFVDAALELIVTPHITPEGTILMDLEVNKNEADFSRTSGDVPTIDTKEISTQVLIKAEDTLAIGGIFKTNKTKDKASVPGLGDIPIFGWLFKTEKNIDEVTEILIFITPRMVTHTAMN